MMVSALDNWLEKRWVRLIGLGIAFWFALFFTFAMASMLDRYNSGREFDHWEVLKLYAIGFGHWIALTPPIYYWSGLPRFVDASLVGKLVQSGAMLVASLAALMLYLLFVASPIYGEPFSSFLEDVRYEQWLWDLVLYVIVVLAGFQGAVSRRNREARIKAAELGQQLAEQQADLSAREAEYLRGRLGSHFVMNALSNLVGLMRLGQVRRAEEATILLSDILRNMTGSRAAEECIPIEEELEDAKKYLAFQQIRFPDLTTEFELSAEAKGACVPRQLLQPVLENVFKHGPRSGAVAIMVRAEVVGAQLYLTVSNNLDSESVDTVTDGEGMQLTKLRLDMAFGEGCSVVRRFRNGWYEAALSLPFKSAEVTP